MSEKFREIRVRAIDLERQGVSIVCVYADDEKSLEECSANARLLAAAPDLLESLQALMGDHGGSIGVSRTDPRALTALAAIAKATGA